MEVSKVAKVVDPIQPQRAELGKPERGRLRLALGQGADLCEAGDIAQYGGAGVYVRVSHRTAEAVSAACGGWLSLREDVVHRLTGRKSLGGFAKLLGLDLATHPAVEQLDDGRSRLQALSLHRADGVGGDMCARVHDDHL
jgi:hypothetical protein